jgi:hypothetical protein
MGLPMTAWLALTRGIDAAKAVEVGRVPLAARFGGRNPLAFIGRGRPEDQGQRVARITSKWDPSKWHDIDRSAHVQYFVADDVVHPIRASYQRVDARSFVNARGELVTVGAKRDYGADEAF